MFEPHETALVPGARVIIHLPRTFAGLLGRRARCVTGVAQIERAQGLDGSADRTRISELTAIIRRRPGMLLRVGYFLSVAVFARLRASRAGARGDYLTWLRDDSSRTAAATAGRPPGPAAAQPPRPRRPRGPRAPSTGGPGHVAILRAVTAGPGGIAELPQRGDPLTEENHYLVWMAGVSWDGIRGTDRHMVTAMACHARILWVDPPVSPVTAVLPRSATHYSPRPEISVVNRQVTRLTPKAMPGLSRPGIRVTTAALVRLQTRWALRRLGIQPFAVVATYPGDLLGYWGGNVVNVFYGTDDYVAGAELMGLSARYQLRQEIRIVGQADVVAAVSPQLAERWAGFGASPVVIPNGCWPIKVGERAALPEQKDLPHPVVGLIGQLSDRIDLSVLNAIADAGFSLLIVGPLDPRWEPATV